MMGVYREKEPLQVVLMSLGILLMWVPPTPTFTLETGPPMNSETVYLGLEGLDDKACGRPGDKPCKTLPFLFDKFKSHKSLTVMASAQGTEVRPFLDCRGQNITWMTSLSLIGYDGMTSIGCRMDGPNALVKLIIKAPPSNDTSNLLVTIENIKFGNIDVIISGYNVKLKNVHFKDAKLRVLAREKLDFAHLENIETKGRSQCKPGTFESCEPSGYVQIMGNFSNISIADSTFYQARAWVQLLGESEVIMDNATFGNDLVNDRGVIGGATFVLWNKAMETRIIVRNSVFQDQFNWSPVDTVQNIYYPTLLVKNFREKIHNNITVLIENVHFINNERAVCLQGDLETVYIKDSLFKGNIAVHAGAGILLLTFKNLFIHNTTFEDNSAGHIRSDNINPYGEYLSIDGDEARVNAVLCKGSVSLIGKGGAIRVQHGNVTVENCNFRNNSARILGGTVFVDRGSKLTIKNSVFSNTNSLSMQSQQGDIIFSSGEVEVFGGTFFVKSTHNHVSLLQHSGDRWSVTVRDVAVTCPMGHRLRVTNTSTYRVVTWTGLKRSYKLDQLSYFCESCPRHKYSTDVGFLHYQLKTELTDYFTLMINGQYPDRNFAGKYVYNDIYCVDCPYGAVCDKNVKPVPNFWGYKLDGHMKFQLCPKGYCCASTNSCVKYDVCSNHRAGQLCGTCEPGYSEALFSPKCVPTVTCGPLWLWPFSLGTGVLYVLFLFFQKDLREFLFSGLNQETISEKIIFHFCRRRRPAYDCSDCSSNGTVENLLANSHKMNADVNASLHINNSKASPAKLDTSSSNANAIYEQNDKGKEGQQNAALLASHYEAIVPETVTPCDKNDEVEEECSKMDKEACELDCEAAPDNDQGDATEPTPEPAPPPATDIGAVLLIIVLYYFQDAMLFQVKTAFDVPESKFWSNVRTVMLGLYQFRLEVAHFVDNVCLLPHLTASQKLLSKSILVPYVLMLFGVLYLLHRFATCLCAVVRRRPTHDGEGEPKEDTFVIRLATGFTLALLFTYQLLATTAFTLLNCVPIGDDNVLFIQGTLKCYQPFQYGVIAYAFCCIIPFTFVLMLGPGLIREHKTGLHTFFLACIFPPPFLVWWVSRGCVVRHNKANRQLTRGGDTEEKRPLSPAAEVVVKVLQGPFRDINSRLLGPICWAGVLIFRRLILVLLFTFINNSLIRVISMLFVCFIIMLNHVHVQPYKDARVNIAGSASVSALMIVGGINLVRAGFEVAEYVPQGPNLTLMRVLKETENVVMLWFPLCILCIFLMVLVIKILFAFITCIRGK